MDWAYRFYIAESIYAYADNKRLTIRLGEILQSKEPEEEKTAEEIIQDVINKHGIRLEE